jgi:hypothetical protein
VSARLSQVSNGPVLNQDCDLPPPCCCSGKPFYTSTTGDLPDGSNINSTSPSTHLHPRRFTIMILRLAWLLATLVPFVSADVKFTSPAAGATVTGPTISISWEESGTSPHISDLASYQLFLCAGGNDASNYVNLTCQSRHRQPLTMGRFNSQPL